jgi:hypothetical protein
MHDAEREQFRRQLDFAEHQLELEQQRSAVFFSKLRQANAILVSLEIAIRRFDATKSEDSAAEVLRRRSELNAYLKQEELKIDKYV